MVQPANEDLTGLELEHGNLVDRPLVLPDRLGPSTTRAAVRRRAPGFFSRPRLRAPTGAISRR